MSDRKENNRGGGASKGRKEGVTTKEITVLSFHSEKNASCTCEPGPKTGMAAGDARTELVRFFDESRGDPRRQSRKPISLPLIFCARMSGSAFP